MWGNGGLADLRFLTYSRWKVIRRYVNVGAALAAPLLFGCFGLAWGAEKPAGTRSRGHSAINGPIQISGGKASKDSTSPLSIKVVLDAPAAFYECKGGVLALREPKPDETHLLKVVVSDRESGRWVPFTSVDVALVAVDTKDVLLTTRSLSLVWDKHATYYGANISLPEGAVGKKVSAFMNLAPAETVVRTTDAADLLPVGLYSLEIGPVGVPQYSRDRQTSLIKLRGKVLELEGRHPPVEPTPYPGSKSRD